MDQRCFMTYGLRVIHFRAIVHYLKQNQPLASVDKKHWYINTNISTNRYFCSRLLLSSCVFIVFKTISKSNKKDK